MGVYGRWQLGAQELTVVEPAWSPARRAYHVLGFLEMAARRQACAALRNVIAGAQAVGAFDAFGVGFSFAKLLEVGEARGCSRLCDFASLCISQHVKIVLFSLFGYAHFLCRRSDIQADPR